MPILKHSHMRNGTMIVDNVAVHIDENGNADVSDEMAKKLSGRFGFFEWLKKEIENLKPPAGKLAEKVEEKPQSKETIKHESEDTPDGKSEQNTDKPEPKFTAEELAGKNIGQLKKIAREAGVELNGANTRDAIISLLTK